MSAAQRVAARYLAKFRPPRKGFPSTELEALAKKWTADAEAHGHDLGAWKRRYKSDPDYWMATCVRCGMTVGIEPPTSRAIHTEKGRGFSTEDPVIRAGDWESHSCMVEPEDVIRGLFVVLEHPEEFLSKPASGTSKALLQAILDRGLGTHWTNPDNRSVAVARL